MQPSEGVASSEAWLAPLPGEADCLAVIVDRAPRDCPVEALPTEHERMRQNMDAWVHMQATLGSLPQTVESFVSQGKPPTRGTYSLFYRYEYEQNRYVGVRALRPEAGLHMLRLADGSHIDQALVAASRLHVAHLAGSGAAPPSALVINLTPTDTGERGSIALPGSCVDICERSVPCRYVQVWESGGVSVSTLDHEEFVCDAFMLMRTLYNHVWTRLRSRLSTQDLRAVATEYENWFAHIIKDMFLGLQQFHALTNMVHNDPSLSNMIVFPGARALPSGISGPPIAMRLTDFDLAWPARDGNMRTIWQLIQVLELGWDEMAPPIVQKLRNVRASDDSQAPRRYIVDYCTACINVITALENIAPMSRFLYKVRIVAAQFVLSALVLWFVDAGGEVGALLHRDLTHLMTHGEFPWKSRPMLRDDFRFELRLLPITRDADMDAERAHAAAVHMWHVHWNG